MMGNQKPTFKKVMRSESGSLLVIAMVGLAILSISFYSGISSLIQTQKQTRMIVIKQKMLGIENRLRSQLMQPSSYEIVAPAKVATLKTDFLESFKTPIVGAKCTPEDCFPGIIVKPGVLDSGGQYVGVLWDAANAKFTASLVYNGTEVNLSDVPVEISVPREVVQLQKYMCGSENPFMAGFSANGDLICRGMPNPSECTEIGGFIASVDSNMKSMCGNFTETISCPETDYISPPGPTWSVEGGWTRSGCTERIDPYSNPELRPE